MTVERCTRGGRIGTSVEILAILGGMSAMALGFRSRAGFVPLLIGVPCTLLGAASMSSTSVGGRRRRNPHARERCAAVPRPEGFMHLWLAAFTLGLIGFGFIGAGSILVFLYLWAGECEPMGVALFAAFVTLAVLWAGFIWLLELTLFPGPIPLT